MATYHFSVKSGKRGSANTHASYIARQGKFGKDLHQDEVVVMSSGNLPAWANGNPFALWSAADKYERSNGSAYREFEMALPAELTTEQQVQLVEEFVALNIGDKPYQYAIHAPQAAMGEVSQPHVHTMFCDRKSDGIERSPELHFKRHNAKRPELGGSKKDSGGKLPVVLKGELIDTRESWANLQNQYLEKYGHEQRVDHRSNRDRNINKEAERHLGKATIQKMTDDEKARYKRNRQ